MDHLINILADFCMRHPFALVIGSDIGKLLGGLSLLLLVAGCLFLAFGKQRAFYYRQGSLVGKLWKAGWLLQLFVLGVCICHIGPGHVDMNTPEFFCALTPEALLLIAMLGGQKYHHSAVKAQRNASQQRSPR